MASFHLACIKWDQKLGGVVESVEPKLSISSNSAMNIYNLHRMRQTGPSFGAIRLKLEGGENFNVATFFSGFGGTSPDGFTANYGKTVIGISERVFALFLPQNVKSQAYEEVMARISSRLLLDQDKIDERVKIIWKVLSDSGLIEKPVELLAFLEKYLDMKLFLNPEQKVTANFYEVKAFHYLLAEKNEHIKDLTLHPADTAFNMNSQKIAETKESQNEIKKLIQQIQDISTQKDITEAVSTQKDDMIGTLKADYIKIFGTLTDQILQLENEIKGISESTQNFVHDLNSSLAEKISKIQELESELEMLKAKVPE
jgi:hypothetical protein